jgi:hypothetical protein
MSDTTVGAGIDLAQTVISVLAPTISQEQKQSLLDAYKTRIEAIQAASDALAAAPDDRDAQLAYGALVGRLLNAGGLTAGGLASITIRVPLDSGNQLLTLAAFAVLIVEQNAIATPPVAK